MSLRIFLGMNILIETILVLLLILLLFFFIKNLLSSSRSNCLIHFQFFKYKYINITTLSSWNGSKFFINNNNIINYKNKIRIPKYIHQVKPSLLLHTMLSKLNVLRKTMNNITG